MFTFLSNLRKQSRAKRRVFAFCFSGGFTLLILLFWFSGFYLKKNTSFEEGVRAEKTPSPFKVIKSYAGDFFTGVDEIFSGTEDLFLELGEEVVTEQSVNMGEVQESVLGEDNEDVNILGPTSVESGPEEYIDSGSDMDGGEF